MRFFDPLPPDPPEPEGDQPTGWRAPAWDRPSEGTFGASVGISMLLGRSDDLAFGIDDVTAYPNGFSFDVVILTTPLRRVDQHAVHMAMLRRVQGPRVGFEFSDGTRMPDAANPYMAAPGTLDKDEHGIPIHPVLVAQGGGGGNRGWTMRYWCFPLPPSGPLHLYYEWVRNGFPEGVAVLDADAIREAATRAVVLW